MSGTAQVNTNNRVYLFQSAAGITLNGTLSRNPAANIATYPAVASGRTLLSGSTAVNYTKFLVNGVSGKINASGQYVP
jgi:peptidoglycan hydrolase-like protein with peptidoglycan-binding domain